MKRICSRAVMDAQNQMLERPLLSLADNWVSFQHRSSQSNRIPIVFLDGCAAKEEQRVPPAWRYQISAERCRKPKIVTRGLSRTRMPLKTTRKEMIWLL